MRSILVPVADRPECAKALHTAFSVASVVNASVTGCHIRPHRYSEATMSTAFADAEWRRKHSKTSSLLARELYEQIAEQHGYDVVRRPRATASAIWQEKVGSPEVVLGIVGPVTDMVVVTRPTKRKGVAEMFLVSALMQSASPVLILPSTVKRSIGKSVIIAWNQSSEVARTVRLSLPMLAKADDVTIVTCGPEDKPGPTSAQLAAYLKQWGIRSTRESTQGRNVELELMAACKDRKADLMVAGAYSRSRWWERAFGGTTEFLLYKARIPLLTLHT